jgi:hypothetical protein
MFSSIPGRCNIFNTRIFFEASDWLWIPFVALSPGMKPSVCESDDSFPSSAAVTNECHLLSLSNNTQWRVQGQIYFLIEKSECQLDATR